MATVPATRAHKLLAGMWLALAALFVVPWLVIGVLLAIGGSDPGPGQQSVNAAITFALLLAAIVAPFLYVRRSRVEISDTGLRVTPVVGATHAYHWTDIRGFSVGELRPGWILWISRWHVVQAELTTGEVVALAATERHGLNDALLVRDSLSASLGTRVATRTTTQGPALPRVYRPTNGDRVLGIMYLIIGVILVIFLPLGFAAAIFGGAETAVDSTVAGATSSSASLPISTLLGWLLLVALAAVYVISRRERVVADEAGLVNVPLVGRARRYPWSAIRAFEVVTSTPYPAGMYRSAPYQVVVATLADGSWVELRATERPGLASTAVNGVRDELEAVRARQSGQPIASATKPASAAARPVAVAQPPRAPLARARLSTSAAPGPARVVIVGLVQAAFFVLFTFAAGGMVYSFEVAADAAPGLSSLFAPVFSASLLIPSMAIATSLLGVEAWIRRGQPVARAFALRPLSAPTSLRNLPAREYAPVVATLELLVFGLVVVVIAAYLPAAVAIGDPFVDLSAGLGLVMWLGVTLIWVRALRLMLAFRSSPSAAATEAEAASTP